MIETVACDPHSSAVYFKMYGDMPSGPVDLNGSVKEPNKFHNYETEKSLVKPVTRQNISSCLYFPPEIVMHEEFNVIVHDDLRWKNRTTRYNCTFSAASLVLRVIFVCQKRPLIYVSCMMISGGRTNYTL